MLTSARTHIKLDLPQEMKAFDKDTFSLEKGAMNTGVGFAILGMLAIFFMGAMMIGTLTPYNNDNDEQSVIVQKVSPEVSKPVLQMQTFPGVTLTPTPTPTFYPQPQEQGGFNYGEPPSGGGGGGSGGGGGGGSAI